jgi:hypothetical protein
MEKTLDSQLQLIVLGQESAQQGLNNAKQSLSGVFQ